MMLKKAIRMAAVTVIVVALTGCGGSSSANTTAGGTGSNGGSAQTIQGIATPESVAVVTATNAN